MRILVVGSDKVYSIENFYVRHLRELGVHVSVFLASAKFRDYYQQRLVNRVLFRAGLSSIYRRINAEFKETVEREAPNIIWVFKGMEIFSSSLQWCRNRNIKLVNYNPDNPFIFSGRGSGNSNITQSIPLYDLHFTYNLEVKKQLENQFKVETSWLPFGFELSESLYKEIEKENEIIEVCFLGNPDRERASFIGKLAKNGIKLSVYGHGWGKFLRHSNAEIHDAVYGDDQWRVLRRYRAQLNLMRRHNLDSHNMRTFEIPAVGGIMVAPVTTEHRLLFENKKEVFLFNDLTESIVQINEILSASSEQAQRIRIEARTRSLNSGYRYEDRARLVFQKLNTLL